MKTSTSPPTTSPADAGAAGAAQEQPAKPRTGFALLDPAVQRERASAGGRAAQARGTCHRFSAAEARDAGRKGGNALSQDKKHMSEIGRIGGLARWKNKPAAQQLLPGTEERHG